MKKLIIALLILLPLTLIAQTDYRYTGQQLDSSSGFYYYGQRYYNPDIGRFNRIDPLLHNPPDQKMLADPQSLNAYSYVKNNPIRFIDPLGLSSATVNPEPENGWQFGDNMGQFNEVIAYYNGIGSANISYSCVEYAKRYMSQMYGINNIGSVGSAKNMWNMNETINGNLSATGSDYSFEKTVNGQGFNLPLAGDLMFWTDGSWGHVMVVTEANFNNQTNSGYVEVIDQNASNTAVRTYNVVQSSTGYTVMKNSSTPMAGWFSPVQNSQTISRPVNPAPSSPVAPMINQPSVQSSFFQRAWTNTRDLLKRFFSF